MAAAFVTVKPARRTWVARRSGWRTVSPSPSPTSWCGPETRRGPLPSHFRESVSGRRGRHSCRSRRPPRPWSSMSRSTGCEHDTAELRNGDSSSSRRVPSSAPPGDTQAGLMLDFPPFCRVIPSKHPAGLTCGWRVGAVRRLRTGAPTLPLDRVLLSPTEPRRPMTTCLAHACAARMNGLVLRLAHQ